MKTKPPSKWVDRLGRRWIPLENASKIFLATYNTVDTKVYRYTVELFEDVDPDRLQQATDKAFDSFDLYRASVRRGFFWYYLEETELRPVVALETDVPCAPIYTHDERGLLFRVLYRKNRIHLEVFHALSDGSGSLRFLRALLSHYFEDNVPIVEDQEDHHMTDGFQGSVDRKERPKLHHMGKHTLMSRILPKKGRKKIFQLKGIQTFDGRMRVTEIRCRTQQVLSLAKQYGTTVTVLLTALFILSIEEQVPAWKRSDELEIAIALSVDLRQFFPSDTARNFFATVVVKHEVTKDLPKFSAVCDSLTAQFKEKITKDNMEKKLDQLLGLEEMTALRWIIRPVKDVILRIANYINNRGITAAMTNTGRLGIGPPHDEKIRSAGILTAAVRPQFSVMSHNDAFTITFTSPFQSDEIQRTFHDLLEREGIETEIFGNRIYGVEKKNALALNTSPYPDILPRYNARYALQWLVLLSVLIAIIAVTVRSRFPFFDLSLRFTLLLIVGLWAVVLSILRKKRNPNKALLYQVGIFSGLTLLSDGLSGWTGWSLTYALPLIVITGVIAALIAAKVSSLRTGDTLLYLQGVAFAGLFPFVVASLRWVDPIWPSLVASTFSTLVLFYTLLRHWGELKTEIGKRFHR